MVLFGDLIVCFLASGQGEVIMVVPWLYGVEFWGNVFYLDLCFPCALMWVFTVFLSVLDAVLAYTLWAIKVWLVLGWVS